MYKKVHESESLPTIDYASRSAIAPPSAGKGVAVMSLLIGLSSLIICVMLVNAASQSLSSANYDQRRRGQAYAGEFGSRHDSAVHNIIAYSILSAFALLLIIAGALLLRGDQRGLKLHWLYVWLQ